MSEWISVKEAAQIRKCTEANIRYYITQGKVEAKKEKGRWRINKESVESEKDFAPEPDVVSILKAELEEKNKQIALLQGELKEQSSRSDTIILQLTRQNQLMLEDKTTPWYRRLFGKKNTLPSNSS